MKPLILISTENESLGAQPSLTQKCRVGFIGLQNIIRFGNNLTKILREPFIIIRMPVLYVLDLAICDDHFIRCNIFRYAFVNIPINPANRMHFNTCFLFWCFHFIICIRIRNLFISGCAAFFIFFPGLCLFQIRCTAFISKALCFRPDIAGITELRLPPISP